MMYSDVFAYKATCTDMIAPPHWDPGPVADAEAPATVMLYTPDTGTDTTCHACGFVTVALKGVPIVKEDNQDVPEYAVVHWDRLGPYGPV